jgi:hypothetical protein
VLNVRGATISNYRAKQSQIYKSSQHKGAGTRRCGYESGAVPEEKSGYAEETSAEVNRAGYLFADTDFTLFDHELQNQPNLLDAKNSRVTANSQQRPAGWLEYLADIRAPDAIPCCNAKLPLRLQRRLNVRAHRFAPPF